MTDFQDFKETVENLQNIDVSEIITSLAMAVIKTQSKLEENSVQQLERFSKYQYEGKSLLELGFMPAFYVVDEASFTTSISLKMAQKEEIDVKAGLKVNYTQGNNLDQSQKDVVNSNKDANGVEGYKSGKTITFLATEKNTIKVGENNVLLVFNPKNGDNFKDCIQMVEGYEDLLYDIADVSEVRTTITIDKQNPKSSWILNIAEEGGYLCLSHPNLNFDNVVIFKHTGSKTDVTIGDGLFEVSSKGFEETLKSVAKSTKVTGWWAVSREGYWYSIHSDHTISEPMERHPLYFNNDKKGDRLIWDKPLHDSKKNELYYLNFYIMLATVLNATGEPVKVTGYSTESNKKMGERRAQSLVRLMKSLGVKNVSSQSEIDAKDCKAKITLNADYILMFKEEATIPYTSDENRFLRVADKIEGAAQIGGVEIKLGPVDAVKEFIETNNTLKDNFLYGMLDNRLLYLLNKKAMLSFQLLFKEASDVKIESVNPEKPNSVLIKDDFSPPKPQTESSPSPGAKDEKEAKSPKETLAIGANLDVRYARQFEMSVEGNTTMSAKIKSVPLPEEFKNLYLKT